MSSDPPIANRVQSFDCAGRYCVRRYSRLWSPPVSGAPLLPTQHRSILDCSPPTFHLSPLQIRPFLPNPTSPNPVRRPRPRYHHRSASSIGPFLQPPSTPTASLANPLVTPSFHLRPRPLTTASAPTKLPYIAQRCLDYLNLWIEQGELGLYRIPGSSSRQILELRRLFDSGLDPDLTRCDFGDVGSPFGGFWFSNVGWRERTFGGL